jgi:5-methylcytosine-specific restriction endonuclease McrA
MANMTPRAKRNRKKRLIEQYGSRCQLCKRGLATAEITLDHITPKSEGGSNNISNLRLACYSCNYRRHH